MSHMKEKNSSKDVYDDDNIPEIDLPRKNSVSPKEDTQEEGQ
ncbi:hypothetical protein [Candidatus Galacturonibacter soehngenii]|nr:hypothetical protein [Candidatus Galacturonibacter soehngenii]